MAISPVGIPYSLQKPKNPYCRDVSLRVATLDRYKRAFPPYITLYDENETKVAVRLRLLRDDISNLYFT